MSRQPAPTLDLHLPPPGRWTWRLRTLELLAECSLRVAARRPVHGPLLHDWPYPFECAVEFARTRMAEAFALPSICQQREYLDAVHFPSSELARVFIFPPEQGQVPGRWFVPYTVGGGPTVLFLHGGGYAFFVRAYDNFIARFALAAQTRTFALDYRLTPEHPFPAQLQDALAAYQWLLQQGIEAAQLVLAGDSAGANLLLSLLLALRDSDLPLPRLAICFSPWVDLTNSCPSMQRNAPYDWIEKRMPDLWAQWLCHGSDPTAPLLSPLYANLRHLPLLHIQAGGAELIIDSILAFADRARAQGVTVDLHVWPTMVHDFPAFGKAAPPFRAVWTRIRELIQTLRAPGGA